MKNIIRGICLVIFASAVFTMCKEAKKPEAEKPPVTKLRETLAALNISDQRAIVAGLPSQIKFAIWKDRMKSAIEEESSAKGKLFLTEMEGLLKPELFVDSLRDSLVASWNPKKMIGDALIAFSNDSLKVSKYLFLLGEPGSKEAIIQEANPALKDCDCSTVSDWCMVWTCRNGDCSSTFWGCGFWQILPCDGLCKP